VPRDPSNPDGLRFETAEGVDHVVFTLPILSEQVLSSLAFTLRSIAARADPRPLVLRSDHPTVFLAGADLREIAVLDSASCVDYADLGRSVVTALESHPAPTVAATAGSCSGGGFDIALACDAIVAGPSASFDHPGVRRGLVTGWTGTVSAPQAIGPTAARAILLEGRRLDAEAALSLGLVGRICADPVRGAVEKALELARLDPSRLRYFRCLRRSRFVDRFRAFVVHKL
jgi:enoyl-CoA hydratase/carnithine racemase